MTAILDAANDEALRSRKQVGFTSWTAYFDALPGGSLIWVVFLIEMLTFALFFFGFAWTGRSEPSLFVASQALLHPNSGTFNTLVLLSGSWMVARAVHETRKQRAVSLWLFGTALTGLIFLGVKLTEYGDIFAKHIRLSTNAFWFYYLFLTILHNLHVLLGVYFLVFLGYKFRNMQVLKPEDCHTLEAVAIYWHLVDLIWVFLFPLLYFTRSW